MKPTVHCKMAERDSEVGPEIHCFHLWMLILREAGHPVVRTLKQPDGEVHAARN